MRAGVPLRRGLTRGPDIDDKNLEHARRNVARNGLQARIRPVRTTAEGPLLPLDELGLDRSVARPSPTRAPLPFPAPSDHN